MSSLFQCVGQSETRASIDAQFVATATGRNQEKFGDAWFPSSRIFPFLWPPATPTSPPTPTDAPACSFQVGICRFFLTCTSRTSCCWWVVRVLPPFCLERSDQRPGCYGPDWFGPQLLGCSARSGRKPKLNAALMLFNVLLVFFFKYCLEAEQPWWKAHSLKLCRFCHLSCHQPQTNRFLFSDENRFKSVRHKQLVKSQK